MEYLVKTRNGKENDGIWVKEHQITDKKRIAQYNAHVIKDRKIQEIIGAAPVGRNVWFYVQWKDNLLQGAWLPSKILKEHYPQDLIRFYERNLTVQ